MVPGETVDDPLRCGVLGEVVLGAGSRSEPVAGRRTAEVLAALLVDVSCPRSVEDLVAAVWGDDAPPTAATMVHGAVRRLRTAAGGDRGRFVVSRGGRYAVAPEVALDAAEFEALVAGARPEVASSPARAARRLSAALALWRGPAYAGVEQPFARDEAARLDALRVECAELLAQAELALGEPARAVAVLAPLVAADPSRERAAGVLMTALAGAGRTAEALRTFDRVRAALAEDLGLEPGPALREIAAGLRRGDDVPDRGSARALRGPPRPLGSFVGREDDLAHLAGLLADHRLVTVTGPGGAGKTRLALEACGRGPARVVFVDLARAASGDRFEDVVADATGVRADPGAVAAVVAVALADAPTLLVLDNAEHVLDRCAAFVRALLESTGGVGVLVTSRERLGLPGEQVSALDPLPLPPPRAEPGEIGRSPAVQLFVRRAAAARSGFALAADNAEAVAEICRRLDGLPLAVELAAARTAALPLAELEAGLGDRFRLLAPSARRHDPSRRAGLAATIAWSRDLLDDAEQRLFARLGVFPAGFDLDAVRAVTGDGHAAATLGRLVDASLVRPEDTAGDRWRYRMLESTREFAVSCLAPGELDALRRRHAHHFLAVGRDAAPHLHRAGAGPWLDALHAERDNLRAALRWAEGTDDSDGDPEVLLWLCDVLWHYWDVRGSRAEGLARLTAALAVVGPDDPRRMALLSACALLHLGRGEFDDTERVAGEQLRLALAAGDRRWEGDAQALRATVDWARGRFDRAQQRYEDGIAASLAGGDVWRGAMAEAQLARLHRDRAEPDAARALARRATDHADEVGEDLARGLALDVLASIEQRWGDPADARRLVEAALEHYRLVGYREGEASALALSARIAAADADLAGARRGFDQAGRIFRRIGHRAGAAATAEELAALG
ncbi:ATP-binding protein [Actinomycetospora sp. C-140]